MKAVSLLIPLAPLMLVATMHLSPVSAQDAAPSAKELASRLSAGLTDGPSYIRLKMENKGGRTFQLQLKQRRTKGGSDILYQVLYPKDRKGESVLLQKPAAGSPTGKIFVPPSTIQNLSSGQMKEPMFGSALSYEDVIDNFFSWEQQSIVGTEEVNHTTCQILESKPGKGNRSSYARVRSWIDTRKMVPLRVEKYSSSGVVRRIETNRVAKDDTDRSVVASLTVQNTGQGSVTEIDGSDSRHDVSYSDGDFTAEGIQKLTPPGSK